jgi:putative membrane protein insertion efficiency factor
VNRYFIAIIRRYRRHLSPFLPQACRFTPSCSEYAIEAFEKKSALRAIWMTALRIAKCHPFHPGGYDPVDPVEKSDRHGRDDITLPLPATSCDGHNKS